MIAGLDISGEKSSAATFLDFLPFLISALLRSTSVNVLSLDCKFCKQRTKGRYFNPFLQDKI